MSAGTHCGDNVAPEVLSCDEEHLLEVLYRSYYRTLVSKAQSLLHDRELAHDVVMDLLIDVKEQYRDLGLKSLSLPYLVRAATNRSITCIRRKQKARARFVPLPDEESPALAASEGIPIYVSELKGVIRATLLEMPRKTRAVFILHRRFRMTYREIAKHRGMSVKSVERHISIALKQLALTGLNDGNS